MRRRTVCLQIDRDILIDAGVGHRARPVTVHALLAQGLKRLRSMPQLLIAHMESGWEEETLRELARHCAEYRPRRLRRGETFSL